MVGSQGNCHFSNTKENSNLQLPSEADNNAKSPLRVKNREGNTRKRKRLNAIKSAEHLYTEGKTRDAKVAKNVSAPHGILGHSEKPLNKGMSIHQYEEPGIIIVGDEYGVDATHTCNNDLEIFKRMFDGDYMKLLDLDSEIEEEKFRNAIERPLSPTLPNIEIEINPSDDSRLSEYNYNTSTVHTYGDSSVILRNGESGKTNNTHVTSCINLDQDAIGVMGTSDSGHKGTKPSRGNESGSVYDDPFQYIVVFPEFRDSGSLSEIFHATKTFMSQCCELSQSDRMFKNVVSALSSDEILSPKKRVCLFFSLFLKSFSTMALTNFNHVFDGNFLNSLDIVSGQLKKVLSDVETRKMFTEVVDLNELITLIQNFIINERVLVCTDVSSDTVSLSDSKALLHHLVLGAILLASVSAVYDRIDSICEASYAILITTSFSTLTFLHVFAYVCGEKLLAHSDYSLIMTLVKSLVTYCERDNLTSGFPPCAKCPFSDGALSMEELTLFLLKRLSGCRMLNYGMTTYKSITVPDETLSDLSDVLSLLELLASKMSWGWVCENIVSQLLKLLEECVTENTSTAVFVLLGQIARLGIDANGFEDTEVENIRLKLSSFISRSNSSKIGLPVQLAAVNALLGTMPLSFQEICKNSLDLPPVVNHSTASDSIQKWFSLLSDEQKSLSVRLLSADVS